MFQGCQEIPHLDSSASTGHAHTISEAQACEQKFCQIPAHTKKDKTIMALQHA